MIKAAWKILDGSDSPTRFHTMLSYVYTPPSESPEDSSRDMLEDKRLALVGLRHVVHKTVSDPAAGCGRRTSTSITIPPWIEVKAGKLQGPLQLLQPRVRQNETLPAINTMPLRSCKPEVNSPSQTASPAKSARVIGLQPDAQKLNDSYRDLLTGTVWYNYRLISTQWPTKSNDPTDPTGAPGSRVPSKQRRWRRTFKRPRAQRFLGCARCHNIATDTACKNADFTYILSRAKVSKSARMNTDSIGICSFRSQASSPASPHPEAGTGGGSQRTAAQERVVASRLKKNTPQAAETLPTSTCCCQ